MRLKLLTCLWMVLFYFLGCPISLVHGECKRTSVAYFLHGVSYTPDSAYNGIRALEFYNRANGGPKFGEYAYAARVSKGALKDLYYSAKQKAMEAGLDFGTGELIRIFLSYLKGEPLNNGSQLTRIVADVIGHAIAAETLVGEFDRKTLEGHLKQIKKDLSEGKKIVIVGHSQGSLYGNILFNSLTADEQKSVRLVYAASVAHNLADGSGRWTNNPGDVVLQIVRASPLVLDPLPYNVQEVDFPNDILNHGFQDYLFYYKDKIIPHVKEAFNEAEYPNQKAGNGPITVELTWGKNKDVDLHVFEPRKHVYYQDPEGEIGFLDIDDVDSFGPEHYYTSCEKIAEGIYDVKLNYYAGDDVENATVIIQAGDKVLKRSILLTSPRGGDGDSSPEYQVGSVVVTKNASGELTFSIR